MATDGNRDRTTTRAKARIGKKAVVGYFTPRLSGALHEISDAEEVSMQALLGEGIDMLLESRGREPLGER